MRSKAILGLALGIPLLASLSLSQPALAQTGQTCGGIAALKCPEGQACQFPEGQCNTPDLAGTCVTVPATCPEKQGPRVCGCDGTTYNNECELLKAGVRQARKGACGNKGGSSAEHRTDVCKTDTDCASTDGQFCEFKAGTCGLSGSGKCVAKGEICTQEVKPVCGCDNKTYSNDCQRRLAGVSLKATGECPGSAKQPS